MLDRVVYAAENSPVFRCALKVMIVASHAADHNFLRGRGRAREFLATAKTQIWGQLHYVTMHSVTQWLLKWFC